MRDTIFLSIGYISGGVADRAGCGGGGGGVVNHGARGVLEGEQQAGQAGGNQ